MLWAASSLASEKTFDTAVSMIPGLAVVVSIAIVAATNVDIPDKVFWYGHLAVFTFAFFIDLLVGNGTGNTILTLKSVEQRTDL